MWESIGSRGGCRLKKSRAENRSSRSQGFTLFEVVVALAIASLGLGFLISAASSGVGNARLADQFIEATRRAQSHLAELGAGKLEPGVKSGDDGGGFAWATRISSLAAHSAMPGQMDAPLSLYDVEVTIRWRAGNSTKSVSLASKLVSQP